MRVVSPAGVRLHDRRRGQRGYAILLILFFVTLILLATIAVSPNILTEGRRERETEMIWRGKQYIRGVKFYYRKTGKFPTSLGDLTKPQIGNVRFMRQAYKDPMNSKDGEWRLIYVGPTGQLIGSLNPSRKLQLQGIQGLAGAVPGTPAAQLGSQSIGQGLGQAASQLFGNTGAATTSSNLNPNAPGQPNSTVGANSSAVSADSNAGSSAPADADALAASEAASEALLNSDPPVVIGGNIIGVGSKINQASIAVYEKAKNYKQFEFIWDPSKDAIVVGGAGGPQIGTPAGLQPATSGSSNPIGNPNSNSPGSILNPPPSPPDTTPQTPPPQQP